MYIFLLKFPVFIHIPSTHRSFPSQCDRLTGGMQKLLEASEQLNELNDKLAIQKVAVTEKTAACENLLAEIAAGTERAEDKKELALAKGK